MKNQDFKMKLTKFLIALSIVVLWSGITMAVDTVVSFKGAHGEYLVAENGGGNTVNANRTRIGNWEKFRLIGQSPFMDRSKIHIKTIGNYYFCSETNGNLIANRTKPSVWETFTIINHSNPGGPLRYNDLISLKSYHNKYVVAESDGRANANRTRLGSWEKFTVVVHSLALPQDGFEQGVNVARGKSATQSSTYNSSGTGISGAASYAVDGNVSGKWRDATVTHTLKTAKPWWKVDLGKKYNIEGVTIWNRTDCCNNRLANFKVDFLDANNNVITTRNHSSGSIRKTNIAISVSGVRSVRIQLNGTDFLSLAEVQIFGQEQFSRGFIKEKIAQLYRNILDREGDEHYLNMHTDRIYNGDWDLKDVASYFFHVPEFYNKSAEEKMEALYRLTRLITPPANGVARWANEYQKGKRSFYSIATVFASGSTFAGLGNDHVNYIKNILDFPNILKTYTHDNAPRQRKAYYRKQILAHDPHGIYQMAIRAYEGEAIRESDLENAIHKALTMETGDFRLAQLVRVLYLTDEYDHKILPSLEDITYWLSYGEDQYCYWSENHMILWMSSAYLLRQLEGWEMDANLDKRLHAYLDAKLRYGFYEFFSTTYLPFTLGALLNLSDFAQNSSIRNKATQAAVKLIKNWLLMTTEKGYIYPAAGRNYPSRYKSFGKRSIAWIARGLGADPVSNDYAGGFLSTSNIDLREAEASWQSVVNTTFSYGHKQSAHKHIYANQSHVDRTVFQWSSGGYFHPDVADDTTWLVDYYDLQDNKHFKMFNDIPNFPDDWSNGFSEIGATFSRSSSISGATLKIYKNRGVALHSIQNYFGGYNGYQQWPWAATVEDIAVWTQSGDIKEGWEAKSKNQNTHLPQVIQDGNVALISYLPNLEIRTAQWLGEYNTRVSLYFPTERFDQIIEHGRWLIGRKGDSYIGVYRYGTGKRNGFYYSNSNRGRQMWAAIVGNKQTHQNFTNFANIVKAATIKDDFPFVFKEGQRVWKTKIWIDGKYLSSRMH